MTCNCGFSFGDRLPEIICTNNHPCCVECLRKAANLAIKYNANMIACILIQSCDGYFPQETVERFLSGSLCKRIYNYGNNNSSNVPVNDNDISISAVGAKPISFEATPQEKGKKKKFKNKNKKTNTAEVIEKNTNVDEHDEKGKMQKIEVDEKLIYFEGMKQIMLNGLLGGNFDPLSSLQNGCLKIAVSMLPPLEPINEDSIVRILYQNVDVSLFLLLNLSMRVFLTDPSCQPLWTFAQSKMREVDGYTILGQRLETYTTPKFRQMIATILGFFHQILPLPTKMFSIVPVLKEIIATQAVHFKDEPLLEGDIMLSNVINALSCVAFTEPNRKVLVDAGIVQSVLPLFTHSDPIISRNSASLVNTCCIRGETKYATTPLKILLFKSFMSLMRAYADRGGSGDGTEVSSTPATASTTHHSSPSSSSSSSSLVPAPMVVECMCQTVSNLLIDNSAMIEYFLECGMVPTLLRVMKRAFDSGCSLASFTLSSSSSSSQYAATSTPLVSNQAGFLKGFEEDTYANRALLSIQRYASRAFKYSVEFAKEHRQTARLVKQNVVPCLIYLLQQYYRLLVGAGYTNVSNNTPSPSSPVRFGRGGRATTPDEDSLCQMVAETLRMITDSGLALLLSGSTGQARNPHRDAFMECLGKGTVDVLVGLFNCLYGMEVHVLPEGGSRHDNDLSSSSSSTSSPFVPSSLSSSLSSSPSSPSSSPSSSPFPSSFPSLTLDQSHIKHDLAFILFNLFKGVRPPFVRAQPPSPLSLSSTSSAIPVSGSTSISQSSSADAAVASSSSPSSPSPSAPLLVAPPSPSFLPVLLFLREHLTGICGPHACDKDGGIPMPTVPYVPQVMMFRIFWPFQSSTPSHAPGHNTSILPENCMGCGEKEHWETVKMVWGHMKGADEVLEAYMREIRGEDPGDEGGSKDGDDGDDDDGDDADAEGRGVDREIGGKGRKKGKGKGKVKMKEKGRTSNKEEKKGSGGGKEKVGSGSSNITVSFGNDKYCRFKGYRTFEMFL